MARGNMGAKLSGYSKPKNALKTLWRLFKYFKHCRAVLICAVISIALYSGATLAASFLTKPLITYLEVNGITQSEAYAKCLAVLCAMGVMYALAVATNYLLNRLMLECAAKILQELRTEMYDHMQDMPLSWFDGHTHGELMSYYSNDVDAVRELLHHSITQMMISVSSLVGIVVLMLVLSPRLFLIMLVMGVLVSVLMQIIGERSGKNFKKQQQVLSKANGYIEETIEGQHEVKSFNHEQKVMEDFELINEELRDVSTRANTLSNIIGPIMNNLSHIFYAITTAVGVLCLTGNGIGGILIAFLQYIRQFSERVSQISQQFNFILLALAGAERIFDVIDCPVEPDEGCVELINVRRGENGSLVESKERTGLWGWRRTDQGETAEITELRGDVRFHDVDFSYDGKTPVLENVSLYAKPGQKIAFVGSTGAGKTTITNLINRFYDIENGEITYDGINVKDIKKANLRHSLGMVLQDTHLFTGTVMENIRYGKLDASDEECINAAKIANAHYFISHLPEGYSTMLHSDGANLSQGQRQLVAIARAAVSDPPVLILDEATSSIDTRTEKLIERGMDELMKGRTVFVIAHRLSTVRNANAIMVLDHGKITERGSHEELLALKGKYYQLYTGMFELN